MIAAEASTMAIDLGAVTVAARHLVSFVACCRAPRGDSGYSTPITQEVR
jgi:hypothetical protein